MTRRHGTTPFIILTYVLANGCATAPTVPPAPGLKPTGAIQIHGDVAWTDGPATLPAGTKVAVFEGNPRAEGIFTMRLKVPAGSRIQPHWHPREERVTVLSGRLRLGFGNTFDESTMTSFGPGSFYVNPPRAPHYLLFEKETVVQLTGVGPWELNYVE